MNTETTQLRSAIAQASAARLKHDIGSEPLDEAIEALKLALTQAERILYSFETEHLYELIRDAHVLLRNYRVSNQA